MTFKLDPRWLAAALIWLVAILVSCLNFNHLQEIATIRERNERLHQEMLFQYRNAEQLNRVQSIQVFCSLPVASAKLGFESIRSRLHGLSANLGFQSVQIEARMEEITENRVPFRLKMQGNYKNADKFLAALQCIPYLAMRSCRIVVGTAKAETEFELDFDFQYKFDPAQELPIPSLQAATSPSSLEAVAR